MNLHNLSDQEFDQSLRDHLEDPGIPYDPVSWNKMSRKLDAVFPPNKGSRGLWTLLMLTGLVSTVFFWSLFTFSQSDDESRNFDQSSVSTGYHDGLEDESISSKQIEIPKSKEYHSQVNEERPQISSVEATLFHRSEKTPSIVSSSKSMAGDQEKQNHHNASSSANQEFSRLSSNQPKTDQEIEAMLQDSIKSLKLSGNQDPPVIERPTRSPWFIGFGYAPDISLVGSGNATSPGTNLNFAVEYKLGRRWSIQSGITYSMKKYKAAGEDYNPPPGFWYYGNAPDNTEGECDVIDIPLNIRYYIKPYSKHRFFASTGLSSYLMLTEDYYYEYDGYQSPDQVESWSVRNENQHYFGVYNLSVGYQRSLGARWSLEIEPFIKLPLSGVGFGRVDLWSTGSIFSLKYNLK